MENCDLRSALRKYYNQRLNPTPGQSPRRMEIRTPYSASSLKLPLLCTDGPGKTCHLLKNLIPVNELLYLTAAEAVAISPQKVAICFFEGIMHQGYCNDALIREHAAIFLQDILTVHRCVECVEIVSSPRGYRGCEMVLFDSLKGNVWLTSLRLSDCALDPSSTSLAAVVIFSLLNLHLQELSLDLIHFFLETPTSLHCLTEGLRLATELRKLKIVEIHVEPQKPSAREFIRRVLHALSHMTTLSSLVLDSTFSSYRGGTKFKSVLARPLAPADLTVLYLSYRDGLQNTALVWNALAENQTVTKLRLKGFTLGLLDARSLSVLLRRNRNILDFDCAHCSWDMGQLTADEMGLRGHTHQLVRLLLTTNSLQRLAVDFCFSRWELFLLLAAANGCLSLQELHFPRLYYESMLGWGNNILPPEMFRKVTIGMCGPRQSLSLLRKAQVQHEVIRAHPVALLGILSAPLSHCNPLLNLRGDWLTSLQLIGLNGDNESEVARALGAYLTVAPHLKRFEVMFSASASSAHEVIIGLVSNSTIQEVEIIGFSLHEEDAEVLSRWVASSRQVHRVNLNLREGEEINVVEKLSPHMDSNYTLTSFTVDESFLNCAQGQHVVNLVRRNYGLLQSAAHFALGNSVKRAAASFEMVSMHPLLPSEVQRIGSVDESGARDRIHESVSRVRNEFWSLAGIVRKQLVCNPSPQPEDSTVCSGQPPQLDELGPYMLAHIRSFLKISEIMDDEDKDDEGD